jgi:hypothetical protein
MPLAQFGPTDEIDAMVVKLCSQIAGYVKTSTDRISAAAS